MKPWSRLVVLPGCLVACLVLPPGCGKDEDVEDSSPVDTAPVDTAPPTPTWPTGDRILMYTGNGGVTGRDSGWGQLDDIDAHWKEKYGWNTDVRDYFSDDLSVYRMIGFMAPGAWGDGEAFSEDVLASLRAAMEGGTRIVVLNDIDNCGGETINQLLEGLGVSMRFDGTGAQEFMVMEATYIGTSQMTDGITSLQFSDPCFVALNGAEYVVHAEGDPIVAWQRPGNGGEVVAIGDFEFLDDSGPMEYAQNRDFADRLAEVEPGYVPEGSAAR